MIDDQASHSASSPIWLIALAYLGAFVLGSCIDIIRHSYDRVAPAIQSNSVDDAIIQRGIIGAVLTLVVIGGAHFGSRWSGNRLGIKHRTGLQLLFVLTPAIVYILEH